MRRLFTYLTLAILAATAPGRASDAGGSKDFTLWQLPSQVDAVGNSYVIRSEGGRVVVLDGGTAGEEPYLRGFLGALGNRVDLWIVTHPHEDHVGALTRILRDPDGIEIAALCHSPLPDELLVLEPRWEPDARAYYNALDSARIETIELREPGRTFEIDGINIKVLGVANPELTSNPYNDSSMILKIWDGSKSLLMLADAGIECGDKLLAGPYRSELDADYVQMAHHGQMGCSRDFYRSIRFRACLWPTPLWVWNNDVGEGFDTAWMETIQTRTWMDELGITEHYIAWQGLACIK